MVLSQNSDSSVYRATTVLIREIRITPDFLAWASHNINSASFNALSLFVFPSFLEPTSTADAAVTGDPNPSKCTIQSNRLFELSLLDLNLLWLWWRPMIMFLRYVSSFRSPGVGRYLVFLPLLNLFYPISRKWRTRSWFHRLLSLMLTSSGRWETLILLILSAKKPTRSLLKGP